MSQFENVSVTKKANVYFDGKCVSHTLQLADGTRKSVGVILPARLTFNTSTPEVMEGVEGRCSVLLQGETEWKQYGAGSTFSVPAHSRFEIEVLPGETYHYVCHFG